MTVFLLDTSVYIMATRDRAFRSRFAEFHRRHGNGLVLSSVVAFELRIGARNAELESALENQIASFTRRGRVVVPTWDTWTHASWTLAALAVHERMDVRASTLLTNDALIAVSARDTDRVLVTANAGDFDAIQRHLRGFRFRTIDEAMQ